MLKIGTKVIVDGDHVDLSFRDQSGSDYPMSAGHNLPYWPDGWDTVLIGDPVVGPVFYMWSTIPGRDLELYSAHMHAADNWRISVRGSFKMANVQYDEGDFRLQRGWKNYPGDSISTGPDGGWLAIMFADRRGSRIRRAKDNVAWNDEESDPGAAIATPWMLEIFGPDVDLFCETSSDESAIATTMPEPERNWHINSSFGASDNWDAVDEGTRASYTLLGERIGGPVLVHSSTQAGHRANPTFTSGTEFVRLIVRGSVTIGDSVYEAGDARVQQAGVPCPEAVAGPNGVSEVVVFGDRRALSLSGADAGWTTQLAESATRLEAILAERAKPVSV